MCFLAIYLTTTSFLQRKQVRTESSVLCTKKDLYILGYSDIILKFNIVAYFTALWNLQIISFSIVLLVLNLPDLKGEIQI